MLLREYLYVDTPTVRAVLAQIDSGIVERTTSGEGHERKTSGGLAKFAEHSQGWSDQSVSEKSLGDYIFPLLESALESQSKIEDVSELINDPAGWDPAQIRRDFPPGKIVRLTGPGYLIDARFLANVLTGFTTTAHGLMNVGALPEVKIDTPPKPAKGQRQRNNNKYRELPNESDAIESGIPIGQIGLGGSEDSLSGEFLRGIVQIARGTFAPGLHLSMAPDVPNAGAISVRLQEGRQYLDTDPDVLFARYGVGAQEWTVVGTVGHHPLEDPDMESVHFMASGGVINRAEFGRYINQLATLLGNLGFTDLPQSPGFSIVPWAVYRVIGDVDYGSPS